MYLICLTHVIVLVGKSDLNPNSIVETKEFLYVGQGCPKCGSRADSALWLIGLDICNVWNLLLAYSNAHEFIFYNGVFFTLMHEKCN